MRYRFNAIDPSKPWHGIEAPVVGMLDMPMAIVADVLDALGWRLKDFYDLRKRAALASAEQMAERAGVKYVGEPANITGRDEILAQQFVVFATLAKAGVGISWNEAGEISLAEYEAIPDSALDRALINGDGDTTDDDEAADPLTASTDSAPADDAPTPATA